MLNLSKKQRNFATNPHRAKEDSAQKNQEQTLQVRRTAQRNQTTTQKKKTVTSSSPKNLASSILLLLSRRPAAVLSSETYPGIFPLLEGVLLFQFSFLVSSALLIWVGVNFLQANPLLSDHPFQNIRCTFFFDLSQILLGPRDIQYKTLSRSRSISREHVLKPPAGTQVKVTRSQAPNLLLHLRNGNKTSANSTFTLVPQS